VCHVLSSLYCFVVFYCVNITQITYSIVITFCLIPILWLLKWCFCDHSGICLSVHVWAHPFGVYISIELLYHWLNIHLPE
jgi:hypothetical protein